MYNYYGLERELVSTFVLAIVVIIAALYLSDFWNKEKRKISAIIAGVFLAIAELYFAGNIMVKMQEQTPESYTGYFVNEQNANKVIPGTIEYCFKDGTSGKYFHLTGESKAEVYPEKFEENQWYIIYYEPIIGSNIIVGVEKIDSNSE